ncbi:MAG: iron-sulfur cluster-binding protein, partial [Planctomycetes bacterium]|nr:iron-sulfur cluster-binding protein [Planctomycetota bacterium]
MNSKSKVAVVIASADSIHQDIARVCDLGGAAEVLPSNSTVVLKDNITWHKPFLSANTTPWQLEGAVKWLQDNNRQMVAVHNDTVVTDPHEGLINLKLQPVYDKYNIEQFFVNNPESVKWNKWRPQGETPWLDKVYPGGPEFPEMFLGKSILHLPTVKTHVYTTTTGAVKNSFGGLLNTRRHYCHTHIHGVLADLIAV